MVYIWDSLGVPIIKLEVTNDEHLYSMPLTFEPQGLAPQGAPDVDCWDEPSPWKASGL